MKADKPRVGWSARAVRFGSALVACAVLLGGCSSVRNALGTTNSPCYIALPAAEGAVHGKGHLGGVRLASVTSLPSFSTLHRAATEPEANARRVCLVAFNGNFRSSKVSRPLGLARGKLAIVVLRYPDGKVLATVILKRLDLHFGHTHLLST